MKDLSLNLYLEINDYNLIFYVGGINVENNFKILYELEVSLEGIENSKVSDLEKVFNKIKENVYLIEQKFNHTFKELVLILDNFNPTFINITGFKKLNSSQVLKENITYILNTIKNSIDEIELKKTILHIFNSKFYLDKKKIKNVPIGLFGDFYSHELSFTLINSNDHKNLKNIFDKCNLKIKKILIKSFIKGAYISDTYKYTDTFFQIRINENNSKIFYFENDTLKFEQNFKFGTSIIAKDISKITTLKLDTIRKILDNVELKENLPEDELIEEEYFNDNNYRKIKKKLVYEIALARIKEISELILFKNINLKHYNKTTKDIFLEIDQNFKFKCLVDIYKTVFSMNDNFKVNFQDILLNKNLLYTANKVVHFGWKKEAIPISNSQKSLIARFFDAIFG
jgi:cell division protein FtsA